MSFTDLVDQLDTYLRCLENLGVTKEKYACILYPLVEASIPEQILIAWERERNSISRNSAANTHDLDLLIQFLRSEVDIDDDTVSFFEKTVKFNQGRYEVNLQWAEGHPKLLDLQFQSEKRLNTMISKLISTGKFDSYDKILKEWEQLGIIEPVPINIKGVNLLQQKCRYLPHRAVFKESSLTTKIRPVFEASAKDENSNSINQGLATGPNYIEMIPSILNKFRKNRLRVREIKIYRHCRVVFGLSSTPFLLIATIYHHLEKERNDIAVK
ncbi:CCHC-type domain-containing protein [Trichonephila clavata]|uniref:CCHC-type domain-containing protein n=1 Tax=Trichonephila clavata TaxID=2740835 RepID=A0A8X6H7B9_TRICU|nr:CCHC-type domain-containing protein [Trichonephila clavata]